MIWFVDDDDSGMMHVAIIEIALNHGMSWYLFGRISVILVCRTWFIICLCVAWVVCVCVCVCTVHHSNNVPE